VVFSNYRKLVGPTDVEKWFGIASEVIEKQSSRKYLAAAG
jgi:hypothetical protein